jgi:hypothetical protein
MMVDEEMYKFLYHGGSVKGLMELAYKKGYDKCHAEAMKYLVEESRK